MPDNDLISRERLFASLKDRFGAPVTDVLYEVNLTIIEQPAIDAAPVIHGTWEPSPDYPGYHRCSVCNDCYIDPAWLSDGKWSFCPNCGAKLKQKGETDAIQA